MGQMDDARELLDISSAERAVCSVRYLYALYQYSTCNTVPVGADFVRVLYQVPGTEPHKTDGGMHGGHACHVILAEGHVEKVRSRVSHLSLSRRRSLAATYTGRAPSLVRGDW